MTLGPVVRDNLESVEAVHRFPAIPPARFRKSLNPIPKYVPDITLILPQSSVVLTTYGQGAGVLLGCVYGGGSGRPEAIKLGA